MDIHTVYELYHNFFLSLFSSLCSVLYEIEVVFDSGSLWNKGSHQKKKNLKSCSLWLFTIFGALSNCSIFTLSSWESNKCEDSQLCSSLDLAQKPQLVQSTVGLTLLLSQQPIAAPSDWHQHTSVSCGKHVDTCVRFFFLTLSDCIAAVAGRATHGYIPIRFCLSSQYGAALAVSLSAYVIQMLAFQGTFQWEISITHSLYWNETMFSGIYLMLSPVI